MTAKTPFFISLKKFILLLVILSCLLLTGIILAGSKETDENKDKPEILEPVKEQSKTAVALMKKLKRYHYLNIKINDSFSSKVFDNYIKLLDPGKVHFLAADINEFSKFRYSFDDDMKDGNLENAFFMYLRYHERRRQRLDYIQGLIEKGLGNMDFTKSESLELERDDLPWLADMDAAKDLWRRLLKNEVLNRMLDDDKSEEIKTSLEKRYKNQIRLLNQINREDVFKYFITAYTHSYDPHTEYMPPADSDNFEMHMRLSLEGIGALLRSDEDGLVKVVSLVAAGPAERGKELKPADRIIAVGQGKDGELVDIEGWRLDDVVDMIRGPKGTIVRLKVIPPSDAVDISKTRIISITRDTVKLEEQSAKKQIIEVTRGEKTYKIGVIELPAFYVDFEAARSGDPNYKSSTRDVEKLVHELLSENIDSLIIDLRSNGGGSLQEANDMTGLFIPTGPVVQIKDADNNIGQAQDRNPKLVYDGPMAVLVNRLSASASEIFACAIQDYGRGIVIGGQTFGKGTVQSLELLKPGRIKYTQAKYYRINGDSTQNRGVIPDISYPTTMDLDEIGESSLPQTMPWDRIRPAIYSKLADLSDVIQYLKKLHEERIKDNPDFKYLNERVEYLEENRKKTSISLNLEDRRQEREAVKERLLSMENRRRTALGEEPYKDYAEMEAAEEKEEGVGEIETTGEKKEEESEAIESDENKEPERAPMLEETGEILTDWLLMKSTQKNQSKNSLLIQKNKTDGSNDL